jgi:flavin-dependent dehydrogenase
MQHAEVIIVGGGPAGSSCAWRLRRHGVDCLILDKETFPRLKLCAGWITPGVVEDLEMDIAAYPHRFLTFNTTRVHVRGVPLKMRSPQHSIRRCEFDHWLLERSGAPVVQHAVREVVEEEGRYVIDGVFECRYLVGAGGTRCPVYRTLFRDLDPRAKALQVAALEHELRFDWHDGDCHLWFFDGGLPGYSWYVPKADGYINLGVGAMAQRLKRRGENIKRYWDAFVRDLRRRGLVAGVELVPQGYSYYLRDAAGVGRNGNAFIAGDAAGLATRDMAEGIGPAVRSGLRVADAIAGGADYDPSRIDAYSLPPGLARRALEYMLIERGPRRI